MLQVARLAPKLLGESGDLVATFLRSQINPDGGFKDRAGRSDLYYTVFGLEGLLALRADLPTSIVRTYLQTHGDGEDLDFVHLACLARCWADLKLSSEAPREVILRSIERHRSVDGGYHASIGAAQGTAYGCFVALGAYQDLGSEPPDPHRMVGCIKALETDDGGYANQAEMPIGLTPATAAAVTLLRHLQEPPRPGVGQWLLNRCHSEGGFFAAPQAPMPDLLSSATALHALAGLQESLESIKEPCLDFIDGLWTSQGGFYGNWSDDELDCEYTYYALLALGHLSL